MIRSVNAVNKDNPMYGRNNLTPEISSCLNSVDAMGVQIENRIRRLTPIECERLQGFPDNWTQGISDTQRYKCLGNAVTTNVIEAIGRQLNI
jgi:site-specific DNA-cytosine methylase